MTGAGVVISGCVVSTQYPGFAGVGAGSGYVDYGGANTYAEWNNVNPGSGTKTLTVKYSNGSTTNRQCEVRVNGAIVGNISLPPTGSWGTWATATFSNVPILSGNNIVRLTANTVNGGPNIDKIAFQ